jgi:ribosome-binding factor A
MPTSRRQQRVAELLREELNLPITAELSDPCLSDALVVVTHVSVSPDMGNARVFVQHEAPDAAARSIVEALAHAEGFLRASLVENLDLRVVPHLSFEIDNTELRGRRIDQILAQINTAPEAGDQDGTTHSS